MFAGPLGRFGVALFLVAIRGHSPPLADASSEEVLALAALEMDPTQDQRLSTLLDRQQAGELDLEERVELVAMMQVDEEGLLRKAQALAESVRRGLRERLTP